MYITSSISHSPRFCALLLGRLRMTIEQAMEELSTIGTAIFPKGPSEISSPEANLDKLRKCIERMLKSFDHPIDLKLRSDSGCKV